MMLLRRRRPNKQADWQHAVGKGVWGVKGAVQLETAPRLNATPLRAIWSDEKYRFGMIELQPVLGWGAGGRLRGGVRGWCSHARVSLALCACVRGPPPTDRVGASLG